MISVVIPLYNKEQSIVRTLDSVMRQTYTDFEVLVVNDGSTDKSPALAEAYPDTRIRVINKENGGVSSARNRGIQEAKGEYVAFLDGDDLWAPTYLSTLYQLIMDYPDASLYTIGYTESYGNNLPVNIDNSHFFRGYVEDPWKSKMHLWTGSSSSSSRADLLAVGGFDERMTHGEDIDLWWRLILRNKAAIDSRCLTFYVQDSENRAMNKVIPLEKHIPYYIDKYADARAQDAAFRKFFDTQMIYRLYPYLFTCKYHCMARRLARKLDYSQLKWSMHFRMVCPYLYRLYERLKNIL